jgi:hypothetical protein
MKWIKHIFPTASDYTIFSASNGAFSKTDNMLGHKEGLKTQKNWSYFLYPKIRNPLHRKLQKVSDTCTPNHTLSNDQLLIEQIQNF